MNQFVAMGLGAIAGWTLVKYLRGSSLKRNPEWHIKRDELDDSLLNVFVGKKLIGSVINIGIPGQKKSWQAADWRDLPMPGEYSTVDAAASAAHAIWTQKKLTEKPKPKYEESALETLEISVPEWVKGVEVESDFESMPGRFGVWVNDEEAGFIDRRGANWDAYFVLSGEAGTRNLQLELGTTRKQAVKAVYCAFVVFQNISLAVDPGRQKSYFPRRYITLPQEPLKRGQVPEQQEAVRQIEDFYTVLHPRLQSAGDIAHDTKIPCSDVIKYARKLAESRMIYGIVAKDAIKSFRRVDVEKIVTPERGYIPESSRRRVIVSLPDIKKLRKSKALTAEEKKQLPRIRQHLVYKFALTGPRGEVGFYKAD